MSDDDARNSAQLTEWELMMLPRYRRSCEALVARPLAIWGHRDELRVLGRTIRPATITVGSSDDWHRERYLTYLAERRRRQAALIASTLRLRSAFRKMGVTMAQAAEGIAAFGRAWGRPLPRREVAVDH